MTLKPDTTPGTKTGDSYFLEFLLMVREDTSSPSTIRIHLLGNDGKTYSVSSNLYLSDQALSLLHRMASLITSNSQAEDFFSSIVSTLCSQLTSWMRTAQRTSDS